MSLPYRCYILNLAKIAPVVLEKKILTDDARRTLHDGSQPIAIGHLNDLVDLKMNSNMNPVYAMISVPSWVGFREDKTVKHL